MRDLVQWKNRDTHLPLIIQGARQVGKTWLMLELGRLHFKRTAYFNFEEKKVLQEVFGKDLDARRIIQELEMLAEFKFTPETLIILDEIQACPVALTALKYLAEGFPQFYIVVAGSLLGLTLHQGISFPVGKVEFLDLYPFNFEEFLMAMGEEIKAEKLLAGDFAALENFHEIYIDLMKRYFYIGGMPRVLEVYLKKEDWPLVRREQKAILNYYLMDFSKHIPSPDLEKTIEVWNNIPAALAKENKKFIYRDLHPGAKSSEYAGAIAWLEACGLAQPVQHVSKPEIPLNAFQDKKGFKLFLNDIGLLGAMNDLAVADLVEGHKLFGQYKGALAEQYVLQEMRAANPNVVINYWSSSTNEVDFVIQYEGQVLPIEVKAGINLQAKSLAKLMEKFNLPRAIRFSGAKYQRGEKIIDYPLYAVGTFFKHYFPDFSKYKL
jgi:hypothetical protein